jgi:aarF domain-containing kinase
MSSHDLVRVFRGVGLVVDQLVAHNKSGLREKVSRAQFHASELMKVAFEIRSDMANNDNNKSSENDHSYSSSAHSAAETSHNSYSAPSAPVPPTPFVSTPIPSTPFVSPIVAPLPTTVSTPASTDSAALHQTSNVSIPISIQDFVKPVEVKHTEKKEKTEDLIGFDPAVKNAEKKAAAAGVVNGVRTSSMRERAVPATQLARMWGFGSLGVRMALGAAGDSVFRTMSGDDKKGISDANAERLAEALCRMRGAALKLGQMLSLQDDGMLPSPLAKALDRVKQAADYMPKHQLEKQLKEQLGPDWRSKLSEFDYIPIAAASIGQVHRARLLDGTEVAMKIQYPGVADSIESDLNNLRRLISVTNMLPPGLFIDQIMTVAREELLIECDYFIEAASQIKYRDLVLSDVALKRHTAVPQVFPELSSKRVLTSTFVSGIAIDQAVLLPQTVRNAIARTMLILTIREVFEWRFIQSDPNFGNFLYHDEERMVNLIDFGAARSYPKDFVDGYMKLVWAAANGNREDLLSISKKVGFLTGDETPEMINAHIETGLVFGEPFRQNEAYNFGTSNLSKRLGKYGEVFLKYRLTPPPPEAYSLHRKLAGAILLSIKLKANIPCRDILETTFTQYNFDNSEEENTENVVKV